MEAYITTHGLYNSGSLYGAWVSLPIDDDGRAAIERIKDADRKAGGDAEMLVADTDGPAWLERTNSLEDLSDQAAWYESLDDDEQDAADAMLTELDQDTVERIIRAGEYLLLEFDCCRYRSFEEQLGQYLLQQGDLPTWAEPYFDFEAYGEAELSSCCHYQDGTTHVLCY